MVFWKEKSWLFCLFYLIFEHCLSILIIVSQETCVVCRLFDQLSIREKPSAMRAFFNWEMFNYLRPFLLMNLLTFLLVVPNSSAISSSEYFQDLIVAETWSCIPLREWLTTTGESAFFFFLQKILSRKVRLDSSSWSLSFAIWQSLRWITVSFLQMQSWSHKTLFLSFLTSKARLRVDLFLMSCFFICMW